MTRPQIDALKVLGEKRAAILNRRTGLVLVRLGLATVSGGTEGYYDRGRKVSYSVAVWQITAKGREVLASL